MKCKLIEDMLLLVPETEFEAQYLHELRNIEVKLDWFDDRSEDEISFSDCGIHLKEKKSDE